MYKTSRIQVSLAFPRTVPSFANQMLVHLMHNFLFHPANSIVPVFFVYWTFSPPRRTSQTPSWAFSYLDKTWILSGLTEMRFLYFHLPPRHNPRKQVISHQLIHPLLKPECIVSLHVLLYFLSFWVVVLHENFSKSLNSGPKIRKVWRLLKYLLGLMRNFKDFRVYNCFILWREHRWILRQEHHYALVHSNLISCHYSDP